jgi:hypothetical protein
MKVNFRKPVVVAAIAGSVLAISGTAAFAYWTASGTGSGTASTASSSADLTVSQATFSGSALVPGGTAQNLSGTIANTNGFAVPVTSFTAGVGVDSGHTGCLASWYSVTNLTATGPAPAQGSIPFSGKIQLTDQTSTNQDACKGATVTVTYTVN